MCTNCPAGQTVSEKCTRRKDTVCEPVKPHINKNQPKLWPEWTEKPKTAHPTTGIVTDIDISEFEDQEEATSNKAFHQQPTEPSLEKNATLKLVVIVVGCCVVFAFVAIVVEKTYSPGKSRTDGCLMCKNCPAGQTVSEKCTRRKDTVCEPVKPHINKNQPKLWPEWTEKPKTAHPTTGIVTDIDISEFEDQEEATSNKAFHQQPTEPSLEKNATLKLVVIVVGCCVVFAFVAIVVVIISRRRKQKRKTSAPPTSTTSTASTARPNIQTNRLSTAPLVQSGSTDKLFRDVPYSLTDHLSRHLNPKGRWKSLAGNLGFSNLDIENFNLQPNSATSSMLYDWGQRRESTLYTLYETLVKMKWVTEAEIVKKYL
ncbi:predicted protein [Nematostella vectensis]|uniref:Death domain-containing protein n=1 Tax=Nematostella vectensis TaxID=45351 RepID=A7SSR3_NEMVE|nr:predicted protein [Nematostella vectensis]|eukprot:XP_001625370.1 predicted protein [Nematostella vectensis]